MKLKKEHAYSIFRVDKVRYQKEIHANNGYIGEILSDSWGDAKEPKERLLWDEDFNSGDIFHYDDIYPELLDFINQSIKDGYEICISENLNNDRTLPIYRYIIQPNTGETVEK